MHKNKMQKGEWTFLDKSTKQYTHGIHLYPARMHPEIATQLISKYANDDTIVFDPFMGSGGVLLESIIQGHDSVGIDINPFAVLLSKVKTTPIQKNLASYLSKIDRNSKRQYENKEYHAEYLPDSFNLDMWYNDNTVNKLSILKHSVMKIINTDVRDFFKICLSLVIRKSSYQRNNSWKIHRISEPENYTPDPFEIFSKISQDNIQRMNALLEANPTGKAYALFGDSRNIDASFDSINDALHDGKANLVITSPPYGDHSTTVAYGQFVKHSSLWLDMPYDDVCAVDSVGLGGKYNKCFYDLESKTLDDTLEQVRKNDILLTKNNKPCRTESVFAFFNDLDSCMRQISENLVKDKSYCCFVVANRTVRRVSIPTDIITVDLGKKYGFKLDKIIQRDIPNKMMPLKNTPENIPKNTGNTMTRESIIIMKY